MSWDVILLKSKIDLEDRDARPGPLGSRSDITEMLTALLPGLDYSDKSWGILDDEEYSIEFNTGAEALTDSIMLHIRGGGNPLVIIKTICDHTGWVALDCSTGTFIDTSNMTDDSWKAFQQYRDGIIGKA